MKKRRQGVQESNAPGPHSLAAAVTGVAREQVERCLTADRPSNDMINEAVASWGWFLGVHGFRLDFQTICESTGHHQPEEIVESIRIQFDSINAVRMQLIDAAARECNRWFIRQRSLIGCGRRRRVPLREAMFLFLAENGPATTASLVDEFGWQPTYIRSMGRKFPELFERPVPGLWQIRKDT